MGPPPVPIKDSPAHRMRSGSGTSRTTATSDSGDPDSLFVGQLSSSPSQPSTGSSSAFFPQPSSSSHTPHAPSTSSVATFSAASVKSQLNPPANPASALSPIANRVRERDADAMEKYLNRNRSGSQGTASTENRSQNDSQLAGVGAFSNDDDIRELMSGTITPRKLRPSLSAAQLRTQASNGHSSTNNGNYPAEMKSRTGTSPTTSRGVISPPPALARSSSTSKSLRSMASADQLTYQQAGGYTGPPSQYAKFPEPPLMMEDQSTPTATTPQTHHHSRRKALQHILSKPLQSFESTSSSHRRGMSAASVRGS